MVDACTSLAMHSDEQLCRVAPYAWKGMVTATHVSVQHLLWVSAAAYLKRLGACMHVSGAVLAETQRNCKSSKQRWSRLQCCRCCKVQGLIGQGVVHDAVKLSGVDCVTICYIVKSF